jgi:hypothetical protein
MKTLRRILFVFYNILIAIGTILLFLPYAVMVVFLFLATGKDYFEILFNYLDDLGLRILGER